jgi:hypothetical protein
MTQVERLYGELSERAREIVFGTLRGYYMDSYEAVAHDITVDFLLFSKSFRKTYRDSEGKLMPFFSSYVRKKLMTVRTNMNFYNNMFVSKGAEVLDKTKIDDEVLDLMEISLALKDAQTYLARFYSGTISLGRLFRLCFVAFTHTGSMNHALMRKRLKCTEGRLKFALAKMRTLLREREKNAKVSPHPDWS